MRSNIGSMRAPFLAITLLALTTVASAQAQKPKKPTTLTLSGCVQQSPTSADEFTLTSENENAGTYRLTGLKVRDYVGKRVEIVGIQPKLVVKGGLFPNPNVAAQAGAMDPTRAATAAAAGPAATTNAPLPEFRVRSIKPVTGACLP